MKILVRAPNWIGDAVMATPTLSALRAHFPSAEITLLARPPIAALFEAHPDVDRRRVYERPGQHDGLGGLFRLIGALRAERFDLAFLLQNAFEAALIAAAAGIPQRVGYAADGRGLLLTRSLNRTAGHQRDAYLRLMRLVGGNDAPAEPPHLVVTADERQQARHRLASHGISEADCCVGVNPGAAYGSAKQWSPARFAAVADQWVEQDGARILIFGGAADREVAEAVGRKMTHPQICLAGQTTIREMMSLLSHCRLLITNDSGPMHVASALGVPVVAVFGPTDPAATSPAGAMHRIVHVPVACAPCTHRVCPIDHRCMEGVSVLAVLDAAREMLDIAHSARPMPAR